MNRSPAISLSLHWNTSAAGISGLSPKSQVRSVPSGLGGGARTARAAVGEGGVRGPGAGVDPPDDHALARVGGAAELLVQDRGADELGAGVGEGLPGGVLLVVGPRGGGGRVGV